MQKKSVAIPFYSLSQEQPLNIHLRYIQDRLEQKRPDFETQHRDSYYIFLFQSHGEIQLMVDFEDVVLKGASIYFLLPGQVHKLISSKNSSRWLHVSTYNATHPETKSSSTRPYNNTAN